MSTRALEAFLQDLAHSLEKTPDFRNDYNLQPHTFIFTPGRLATQMKRAAKRSSEDGWNVTKEDNKYIEDAAKRHGKELVTYVKTLGGKLYGSGRSGVILEFTTSTDQEVLTPKWMRKYPNMPKIFDQTNIYQKVRSSYSDVIEKFFTDVQNYFKSQGEYTSKSTNRKRKKALRTSRGKLATSAGSVLQAGHLHGAGVLETTMRDIFKTTYDQHSTALEKEGYAQAKDVQSRMEKMGFNFSIVRADDGEGFIIMLEDRAGNNLMGQSAKAAKKEFIELLKEGLSQEKIEKIEGSDSIVSRNRKLIIKDLERHFRRNTLVSRVKTEDTTLKASTKRKVSKIVGKPKILPAKQLEMGKMPAIAAGRKRQERRPPSPKMNLAGILGVINQQLPDRVTKNMGDPRLENRTGRFANSVRVTDIATTAQGFPSIGFTYAKEPYQVYETTSGSRFADAFRDPRPLIDQSIREIVAQFGLGRLYTRRV